jgi:predicted nucleic acid-binding protein
LTPTTQAFARINTSAQAAGNRVSIADGAIAAIAMAHGYMLATRNIRDFRAADVTTIDPWIPRN